jgi:hypothetical protein
MVLLAGIAFAWWAQHRKPAVYSTAYVGDRTATLWSTTAQVRQTVATLHYGDRVAVMRRNGDQEQVRTDAGVQGWIDAKLLMSPDLWRRAGELVAQAKQMPVQATGHTRTFSNIRVEPGRDAPRIFQFARNVPVAVLERRTAAAPTVPEPALRPNTAVPDDPKAADAQTAGPEQPKKEDWLLVLRKGPDHVTGTQSSTAQASSDPVASGGSVSTSADTDASTPIAGWVLSRFIELEPPAPIPDYSNAAGMHVVAWAVLNSIADASGSKPQYVVAGTRGGEGQACDFTLLRVYTWGKTRQRYETAYVEGNLCGRMPLRVRSTPAGPEFHFAEADKTGSERAYIMRETVVRRVNEGTPFTRKRR